MPSCNLPVSGSLLWQPELTKAQSEADPDVASQTSVPELWTKCFSVPWRELAWCLRLYWLPTPKILFPDFITGCYNCSFGAAATFRSTGAVLPLSMKPKHFLFLKLSLSHRCHSRALFNFKSIGTSQAPQAGSLSILFFALLGMDARTL